MGFTWKRSVSKRKVLIERRDDIDWRCRYLIKMRQAREKLNIFFVDETWVDSNLTFRKCWQGPGSRGVMDTVSGRNRLIVVHIGSKDGFLPGAQLVYKANSTTGDYHGQMNCDKFSRWITQQFIPKLPPNSVVVMDNAPYHSTMHNKTRGKYANKRIGCRRTDVWLTSQ
jgi:hypothetical protein